MQANSTTTKKKNASGNILVAIAGENSSHVIPPVVQHERAAESVSLAAKLEALVAELKDKLIGDEIALDKACTKADSMALLAELEAVAAEFLEKAESVALPDELEAVELLVTMLEAKLEPHR